jgi:hypothetical protein
MKSDHYSGAFSDVPFPRYQANNKVASAMETTTANSLENVYATSARLTAEKQPQSRSVAAFNGDCSSPITHASAEAFFQL